MNGTPLGPIGRGLMDGIAPTEAPAGTYREGRNVRGVDPRTGRVVWGAQRAGLDEFGEDFAGGHPTHFCTAFRLRRAREWYELTNVAETSTVPQTVSEAWQTDLDGAALDVAIGPDKQAYYLLESGDVSVVNQQGRVVERIRSASRYAYSTVPRIAVAEDGTVFLAETNTRDDELPRGYLKRWVREEDKTWTEAWEAEFEDPISIFGYRLGALYVSLAPQEDENEVLPSGKLARISQPLFGPQVAWERSGIPRPVLDLTVNDRGQALISCPSNEERQAADAGFGARTVDWVPSELTDWEIDGWAWFDAYHVNESSDGLAQGTAVNKMRDRRHEESIFAQPDETSPVRDLTRAPGGIFSAPTYDPDAFGGAGGVSFDSRQALVSGFNTSVTGQQPNLGVIPSHGLRNPLGPHSYLVAMVIQLSEDQMALTAERRILGQENDISGSEPSWEIATSAATAGRIVVSDTNTGAGGTVDTVSSIDTTTRSVVLTWYHDDQVGAQDVELFVDGSLTAVSTDTVSGPIQGGPWAHAGGSTAELAGPFTVLGGGLPNRRNLARETGVGLSSGGFTLGGLSVLRDGYTPPILSQGGQISDSVFLAENAYIEIDFGAAIRFDSIGFFSSRTEASGAGLSIAWGSAPGPTTAPIFTTLSTVTEQTGSRYDAITLETGVSSSRYLRVTVTNGSLWLGELEVYYQNTGAFADTASFTIGELITTSIVDANATTDRQLLEGYLAHRWGLQGQLPGGHPYAGAAPSGAGSTARQDRGQIAQALRSPDPILAKFSSDGEAVAAYTGAGVGLGAAVREDTIFTIGEVMATPTPNFGTMLTKFTDSGYSFTREVGFAGGTEDPAIKTTRPVIGPVDSLYIHYQPAVNGPTGVESVRRYDAALTASPTNPLWTLAMQDPSSNPVRVTGIAAGGAEIDESLRLGSSGYEFLFVALDGGIEQARRVDTLGLRDTGETAGRDAEHLVVLSNGDVVRQNADGSWDVREAGALVGDRPGSAVLYGKTFLADGLAYRVYDHATGQLRDFAASVKGEFPPRCRLIAAYSGRLIVAGGDNAFTIYQSRYGDPFDFDYGPEIQTISQAIAGTTASQGAPPEPVTALMPFRDSRLYIGTTESLFVQTGDLADGGRLDQLDKSQGVAPGYAWCESPLGIYYFSSRGGVVFIDPSRGPSFVSSGKVQRRLEEIDLTANRIDLAYNWIDKTVHVFVIPNSLGSDTEHYVYEEPMAAWHMDTFGEGYERALTCAVSQVGDTPEDRALFLGFAGKYARRWDQYALDDAGDPISSRATVGPIISGLAGVETRVQGFHAQLASDQGPVEVSVRGSESADAPGPPGVFERLEPGRGLGVPANVCAPAVFVELRGTGQAWSIHEFRAEVTPEGSSRSTS